MIISGDIESSAVHSDVAFPVKRIAKFLMVIVGLGMTPASAETLSCEDILELVMLSEKGFYPVQKTTQSEFGGFETTKILQDAQYCLIFEDPEKRSYKCTWQYAMGSDQATNSFDHFVRDMGACLGDSASRSTDQPVNHPDTYQSYLYQYSDTELRVTLKDKSELMHTLVSVIIQGRHISQK